jgi:pilus assembly protein CpaF
MKTFGKRERDGTPTRLPALTPTPLPGLTSRRDEAPAEKPVMPASLRERVIEQIDPSVAATVSRDVLRRQIEEIIHAIAN